MTCYAFFPLGFRNEKNADLVYKVFFIDDLVYKVGCALVMNLQIMNFGSQSCHERAFWSLRDGGVCFVCANNPYMFVSFNGFAISQ
jgi:hypothetical protein